MEGEQFLTNGSSPIAGTYTLADFIVQSSNVGATIGSMSSGQYSASGYVTMLPYDFNWDGTAVTMWNSAGTNSFDWWVFSQVSDATKFYFFGWAQGNINTVDQGTYFDRRNVLNEHSYTVTVTPSNVVPEPSSIVLLAMGPVRLQSCGVVAPPGLPRQHVGSLVRKVKVRRAAHCV